MVLSRYVLPSFTIARPAARVNQPEACEELVSLIAMERHLLFLSNEYNRELNEALERGAKPKSRFSSIETYDLWLAIHAFFLAAGSARDYLAQALVDFIYRDIVGPKTKKKLASMGSFLKDGLALHKLQAG